MALSTNPGLLFPSILYFIYDWERCWTEDVPAEKRKKEKGPPDPRTSLFTFCHCDHRPMFKHASVFYPFDFTYCAKLLCRYGSSDVITFLSLDIFLSSNQKARHNLRVNQDGGCSLQRDRCNPTCLLRPVTSVFLYFLLTSICNLLKSMFVQNWLCLI